MTPSTDQPGHDNEHDNEHDNGHDTGRERQQVSGHDAGRDGTEGPAGVQRTGTGRGARPNAAEPAQPDAASPASQRPAEQEGPVGADGAEQPPTDRTGDPATWEQAAQGDVSGPDGRPDPRVSTVPLDTDEGDTVVIQQQNAGPGRQVGGGEFKEPGTASEHKDPATAAKEQERLERESPVDASRDDTAGGIDDPRDGGR